MYWSMLQSKQKPPGTTHTTHQMLNHHQRWLKSYVCCIEDVMLKLKKKKKRNCVDIVPAGTNRQALHYVNLDTLITYAGINSDDIYYLQSDYGRDVE